MKRIENNVSEFDFVECGRKHELGNTTVEAHVPHFDDLLGWAGDTKFAAILADPPGAFRTAQERLPPSINA